MFAHGQWEGECVCVTRMCVCDCPSVHVSIGQRKPSWVWKYCLLLNYIAFPSAGLIKRSEMFRLFPRAALSAHRHPSTVGVQDDTNIPALQFLLNVTMETVPPRVIVYNRCSRISLFDLKRWF